MKLGRVFTWKRRPTTQQRVELLVKLLESKFNWELEPTENEGKGDLGISEAAIRMK